MGFFEFAGEILPRLLHATVTTLELTAASVLLGLVVGLLLALGRVYGARPLRWLSSGYIQFFRGTPLLVQLLIVYYGLPPYLAMIGIRLSPLVAAIIGLDMEVPDMRVCLPSGASEGEGGISLDLTDSMPCS